MRRHRCFYRTRCRRSDFEFSFEEQPDGSWRAYILSQPPYRGRCEDELETHRLTGGDGRRYVCFEPSPSSLSDMKAVAALWADTTMIYIETGVFTPSAVS